jgi:disulfide bond formation protein DsbB
VEVLARTCRLFRTDQQSRLGQQHAETTQDIRIVRCDEAAWRFLGISLAGYDVLVSLFLAIVAAWGAKASLARRKTSG